jgi:hypothetical protein
MTGKRKREALFRLGLLSSLIPLIFLSPAGAQVKPETEPNDNREQAQEIRVGDAVEGEFQQDRDNDWFKLIVDKTGKNYLQVVLSAVPEVDTYLSLLNAQGQALTDTNNAPKSEAESIDHFPVEPGSYYLRISARGKAAGEKYTLTTKITGPWQDGWETEPNDRSDAANSLKWGQSIQGYFDHRSEEDWFKLDNDLPGRTLVRVDLSAVSGVNSELSLHDERGNRVWRANDNKENAPESIFNLALDQGTYFIRVYGRDANKNDPYTMSTQVLGPWQENQEAEPNNDIKQASALKLNLPLTGHLNAEDDRDYYLLNIPAPGIDTIVMEISGIPGVRWSLELFDLKEKRLDSSNQGEAGQGEEIVKMKFQPGAYYLRVRARSGQSTGVEYSLYAGNPQKSPASPEEVQQALIKALDQLASTQRKDGSWERYPQAYTGLAVMAFVGAKCVQKDYSSNVKAALDFLKSKYTPGSKYPEGSRDAAARGGSFGTQEMYQHAIATLAVIEALVDLNDESLEPIAREAVQLILRSQNTEHKPEALKGPIPPDSRAYGGWRYNPDSTDSDISLTGWQVLALKAAVNAGFTVPDHVFPAAAGFVRSLQGKSDGSFRYDSPGESGSSCARAGMGALSLQLCGFPKDPMIPPAIRFMQDYPPRWNIEEPGNGYPFYYWYYGTRAMYLAGGEDWAIWKDWMCRFLLDHQNADGSWDGDQSEENLDVYRVALGALMLEFCCGHVPIYMSPVKRLGSGTVKVEFEKGAEKETSKNVEIIMDASNSMWGQIAGEAKITIARKVLTQIINGLPESMNVGMRAYGHRYGLNDRRACTDTELLVPIGPLAKAQLVDTVNKIQLKGKTPLVLSVLEAIKDFEKIPNGSVILVTDGIESCNGDIMSIAPAIKTSGLELKVHIVGFDIKEKESREQLEAIAQSTEGRYLDAKNAGELLSALEQTLQVEFVVLNEKGEEAGRGIVGGEEVKLKEGTYTLRVLIAPQPLEVKIAVKPDGRSVCVLKKEAESWKLGC